MCSWNCTSHSVVDLDLWLPPLSCITGEMCIWALQEAQNLNDNVVDAKECFARAGYMLYKGDWESWVAIVVPRSLSCSVRWSSITEFSTFMYAVAVVIGDVAVINELLFCA